MIRKLRQKHYLCRPTTSIKNKLMEQTKCNIEKMKHPQCAGYVAIAEVESHILSECMMVIQKEYKRR